MPIVETRFRAIASWLDKVNDHRPTLEALVRIHETRQLWPEVVTFKRQILDGVFLVALS